MHIERLDILKNIFHHIIVPKQVYDELCAIPKQKIVLETQSWIACQEVQNHTFYNQVVEDLDFGEAEAITLAHELSADYLIIDERKGRQVAENLGIKVIGLLGVLVLAKHQNIITAVKPIALDLLRVGFYINQKLLLRVLQSVDETL
jgi:predicted nucleic acid-binding protein